MSHCDKVCFDRHSGALTGLEDIGDLVTYSQARFSPDAEVSLSKECMHRP